MNLSKPQRVAAMSSAGTLLAGVGAAVGTADWRLGLYGLLVSVLAGVSGALWPSKPTSPTAPAATATNRVFLDGQEIATRSNTVTYTPPAGSGVTHNLGITTPTVHYATPATASLIESMGPLGSGLLPPAGQGADSSKPDDEPPTAPTPVG